MNVLDLPIYREYFGTFLIIIKKLDELKQQNTSHRKLIDNAYSHVIEIFPNLTAGYNYWSMKGKLQICTIIENYWHAKNVSFLSI